MPAALLAPCILPPHLGEVVVAAVHAAVHEDYRATRVLGHLSEQFEELGAAGQVVSALRLAGTGPLGLFESSSLTASKMLPCSSAAEWADALHIWLCPCCPGSERRSATAPVEERKREQVIPAGPHLIPILVAVPVVIHGLQVIDGHLPIHHCRPGLQAVRVAAGLGGLVWYRQGGGAGNPARPPQQWKLTAATATIRGKPSTSWPGVSHSRKQPNCP